VTFTQRLVGATMLDASVYEDVEADPSATWQAAVVVLLSSLAAGVSTGAPTLEARAMIVGTIGGFVGWVSWAALTYLLGTHLLPESRRHELTWANCCERSRSLPRQASCASLEPCRR
jgi:hypothetical protein